MISADPTVYMCYMLDMKYKKEFKKMLYHYKKENKCYNDSIQMRELAKLLKSYRFQFKHTRKSKKWKNLDADRFMEFIDKNFNWSKKGTICLEEDQEKLESPKKK